MRRTAVILAVLLSACGSAEHVENTNQVAPVIFPEPPLPVPDVPVPPPAVPPMDTCDDTRLAARDLSGVCRAGTMGALEAVDA